jgi:hypothetical protein
MLNSHFLGKFFYQKDWLAHLKIFFSKAVIHGGPKYQS